jgi:hypothetical protein
MIIMIVFMILLIVIIIQIIITLSSFIKYHQHIIPIILSSSYPMPSKRDLPKSFFNAS